MRGYIVKRGKRFAAVVYLGVDPTTKRERRKWYSHGTRREAEAHLTHLVSQVQAGYTPPSTRLRVGEYLEQWLQDYAAGAVGQVTLASNRDTIKKHSPPPLGTSP